MQILICGLGAVGAMAAWRLAKAGHEVIALEQFRLDHDRGSSYGDSRIVRRVYPDPLYTALMADAYTLWMELRSEAPDAPKSSLVPSVWNELFVRSGGIFCGPADHPHIVAARQALETSQVPYEVLTPAQCAARFPAFPLREEEIALFEPTMGYARASRCVVQAAHLARGYGAQLIEANPITQIAPGLQGAGVRVTVRSGETFHADRLLLTAGAWTRPLCQELGLDLPLTVTRQAYVHLKPARNPQNFTDRRFPVWIDAAANAYGFPVLGTVPGVKIGIHHHGAVTTPESVDREVRQEDRDAVLAYAATRFPDLSAETVYEKVCLYTNTPDEDFIIDRIPALQDGVVISACSGHGFKFTPLLGQIGADLVTDQPIPYDLSRFRLSRFAPDT